MGAVLTSPMPVARPKIHRLPAANASKRHSVAFKDTQLGKAIAYAPHVAGGALVLALLAAIPPQKHETQAYEKVEKVRKAALVPQISVTPEQDTTLAADADKSTTLAMNDARTAPLVVAVETPAPIVNPAAMPDSSRGKTIVLQGQNDAIIGQMARIPLENEQITEIKPASVVDNSAGRELLSIINKY